MDREKEKISLNHFIINKLVLGKNVRLMTCVQNRMDSLESSTLRKTGKTSLCEKTILPTERRQQALEIPK